MCGMICINSLWFSDTVWHQAFRSILVKAMAWCWTGIKPLPILMLTFWHSDHGNNLGEIWIKISEFPFKKIYLKILSAKWWSFCCGFNVLMWHFRGCKLGSLLSNWVNTLRPRQDGCHFADNIFKCIFLNENISIEISLEFVPKGPINNTQHWFK